MANPMINVNSIINLENLELAINQAKKVIEDLNLKFINVEYNAPTSTKLVGDVRIVVGSLPKNFIATLKEKGYTKFRINMENNFNIYDIDLSYSPALEDNTRILTPSVQITYVDSDNLGIQ